MIRQGTSAALAMALTTASLSAQASRAACDFKSDGTPTINIASENIGKFNATTDRADQMTHIRAAVKALSEPGPRTDPILRNWMMGQALIAYSMVEDAPLIVKRGEIGYTTNTDAEINVIAVADSAFDEVSQAKPCAEKQVQQMRQLGVSRVVNAAIASLNGGDAEKAMQLAEAAVAMDSDVAPAHHLIGVVAVQQRDYDKAFDALSKAADLAQADSQYADIRRSSLLNLAVLAQNKAEALTGEEQKAMAMRSAEYFREHLSNSPDDTNAKTGLARALAMSGDSSAVAGIYAEMTSDPSKFDAMQLADAGVGALNEERFADAVTLLEAARVKNPYYRDFLFALSIAYSRTEEYDKMLPVVHALTKVDPNNPDNYNLLGQAYQGMIEKADRKDRKAYTDSLVKNQLATGKIPVKVTFRGIESTSDSRMLVGDVENLRAEPQPVRLSFELLDATGNVVGREEAAVGEIAGNGTAQFSVPLTVPSVVAYRYAPIR